jgi:hypothetical protein
MNLNRLRTIVALLIAAQSFAAKSDVTLAWNPVPGAVVTNYTLSWGTNSGVYIFEADAGTQTTLTVTGLAPGTVYYFSVMATAQDGTQSGDSSEVVYTNAGSITPPVPTGPGSGTNSGGGTTNIAGGGLSGSGGSGGSSSSSGSSGSSSGGGSTGEVTVPGVPPVLALGFTNNHPLLKISGTVGSTLMIQSSTNAQNQDSWSVITNLAMTNVDTSAPTNSGASSTINLAFVPAAQNYEVIDTTPPTCEFYQVMMPYDYMVLADSVLSGQGYTNRLLLVRMPGISSDDVCYVTPQSSFLFYDSTNQAFALEPSGSTIRQIATTLSGSLGHNWTSASEFAYSNGVSTILATVVKTEPASVDPVAGAATPSILIDF